MKTNKEIIEEFREKFFGECPPYHNGITHETFPAEWKAKMLERKELESFILQALTERTEEIKKEIHKIYAYVDIMWVQEHNEKRSDELLTEVLKEIEKFLEKLEDNK